MSIQVVVLIRNQNITNDKTGFREKIKDKKFCSYSSRKCGYVQLTNPLEITALSGTI